MAENLAVGKLNYTSEISFEESCRKTRYAPRFLLSIIGTYICGIVFILFVRLIKKILFKIQRRKRAQEILREKLKVEPSRIKRSATQDTLISINSFEDNIITVSNANLGCFYACLRNTERCYLFLHRWCIKILSYQSIHGQFFIHLTFIFSIISYMIYAVEEIRRGDRIEKCARSGRHTRLMDFVFHLFFLLHFVLRWTAANNSLAFWFDGLTAVDCCTIPPAIFGFFWDHSWSGLRFLRIFRLINLAEVGHNLSVIKTVQTLKLVRMITMFIAIWLSGAGFFHLLENTGDPWNDFSNKGEISYIDSLYFTMVTLSTVGYGDITPHTDMAKMFLLFFILFALANFAKAVPEIAGLVNLLNKYSGVYEKEHNRPHVVVCGDVTTDSVKHFLDDFLHKDRNNSDVEVVFINRRKPDIQLGSILKRNFGTVMDHYDLERVKITEADACLVLADARSKNEDEEDAANIMRVIAVKNYCPRVRIIVQLLHYNNKAFLLNIPSWNWNNGDEIICFSELKLGFLAQSCNALGFSTLLTNLFSMRSLHGANEAAFAVVDYENKNVEVNEALINSNTHFKENNSPTSPEKKLNPDGGGGKEMEKSKDCPKKKKRMSLIKQKSIEINSQLNKIETALFDTPDEAIQDNNNNEWLHEYLRGVSMEIYSGKFSPAFCGLTFNEAAVICKKKLDLILIAVVAKVSHENIVKDQILGAAELRSPNDDDEEYPGFSYYLAISPLSDTESTIKYETRGFFICDSQEVASRAQNYCTKCHENVTCPDQITTCKCFSRSSGWRKKLHRLKDSKKPSQMDAIIEEETDVNDEKVSFMPQISETHQIQGQDLRFDMTGMYHWCPTKTVEEVLLRSTRHPYVLKDFARNVLHNHIVLCIISDNESPLLGLRSFIMPLRSSNLHTSQLKPIILFGNIDYLMREWPSISNLPEVYIFGGNPSSRVDLRAIRIQFCSICVIVNSRIGIKSDDPYMIDKEVILCSLNIKAMKFPYQTLKGDYKQFKLPVRKTGADIPLITELCNDANIHYLDPDLKHYNISDNPVFLSPPFAKGIAFTTSVLDALASTAYFDRNNMTLIRHLVTGGVTPALDLILAEGDDLEESQIDQNHLKQNRCRPRVDLISFTHPALYSVTDNASKSMPFEEVFVQCSKKLNILCLGIYRINKDSTSESWSKGKLHESHGKGRRLSTLALPVDRMIRSQSLKKSNLLTTQEGDCDVSSPTPSPVQEEDASYMNRYVITNPPNDFIVKPSDLIYALCPFEFHTKRKK